MWPEGAPAIPTWGSLKSSHPSSRVSFLRVKYARRASASPRRTPESPRSVSSTMGAVVSLAVAGQSRLSNMARASFSAIASRRSSRSSHRSGEFTGRESALEVTVIDDLEQSKRMPKRVPRSMQPQRSTHYGTPLEALLSPFVLGQVAFNCISSVGCSVGLFYLLFVVLVVPPGGSLLIYHWTNPNLIGVVVGSALIVSPTLVMILAPAGIPEAVDKGWFVVVRPRDCPPWLLRAAPFLGTHERWRRGMLRHVTLGLMLSMVFIPVPLLIAVYGVADDEGNMSTWTLIWFDLVFETVLAIPCTLFGLLYASQS